MGDLLAQGQAWLADQLARHVSRPVIYRQGNAQVSVNATIGRTLLSLENEIGGARMEWTDRDFLIRAEELALGAIPVSPRRGDQIIETTDSHTLVYEVLAPANEPVWRWADPHRKMLRIHTKQIT